ncbi:MAG: hypothetical protein KTV77_04270 [Wolbachia endosymbiont of Fragariocoptes setiger]|nr:hypothetical protein [Wolbachia endosymbiont of Fragariocoptes setiger]
MIIVYKKNLIYFSVLFVFTEKNNLYIILDPYLEVIVLAANQVSILEIRIAIKKS